MHTSPVSNQVPQMPSSSETDIARTYQDIAEAEKKAESLERMLDKLDQKMDSILEELKNPDQELITKEACDRDSCK